MYSSINWINILRNTLDELFRQSQLKPNEIRKKAEKLNKGYISNTFCIDNEIDALTYALYFLPEHIPKMFFVYTEISKRYPDFLKRIENIYDLGCGGGTAAVLISLINQEKKNLFLVDKNTFMLSVAERIFKKLSNSEYKIIKADFFKNFTFLAEPSLYIFMNSLSENSKRMDESINIIANLLEINPFNIIIVIEPIKIDSIKLLKILRKRFVGNIIAPCLYQDNCPLIQSADDICRFNIKQNYSIQLQTVINAGHRFAKFSYLVLSKTIKTQETKLYRLLEYPYKRNFGYELLLCNGSIISRIKVFLKGEEDKRKIKLLNPNDIIKILDLNQNSIINAEQIEIIN